jgi:hypothetical protein
MIMKLSMSWLFGRGQWIASWVAFGVACVIAPAALMGAGCVEPLCRTAEIPDVGSFVGNAIFTGRIAGPDDVFQPSCGSAGAPDSAFSWRAPSSGRYRFDTSGSGLDTVLSLWAGDVCDGDELACDDDGYSWSYESVIDVELEAGETVYVAVEGYHGTIGEFVVNVQKLLEWHCSDGWDDDDDGLVDCADPDCGCECPNGMLPVTLDEPVVGSTVGGKDFSAGSCGGTAAPDATMTWTPPRTGRYRISTEGSTFDTVLYVQQGDVCGGAELACDDDANGWHSEVELGLTAGQTVIITVDGRYGEGEYVLDIAEVPERDCYNRIDDDEDGALDCDDDDCDCTCPVQDLGSVLGLGVYTGSTVDQGNHRAGSCGGANAPDASFAWTAPETANYRIHTDGSDFDTVLYVQEGDVCGGAELACNDDTFGVLSQVELGLTAGQTVIITVDGFGGAGSFTLNIEPVVDGGGIPTSGLHLWLRADAGVTASGGRVSEWRDQSGHERHGIMPASSRQPYLVTSALNGLPVLRFAGAQSLYLSTVAEPTTFTVFVVGKNSKASESYSMILGPGGNFPNNQLRWDNGSQVLFVGVGNSMPTIVTSVGNTRAYHALAARYDGSNMSVYRDGNFVSSHSFTTSGPWTLASVGSWFSTYFMEGDLAEVIVYDRALSEAERTTVDAHLESKYDLL